MYKDYALIIGINDYTPEEDSGLPKLDAAISDAKDFEKWFLEESGFGHADRCKSVYSTSNPLTPIHHQIEGKLTELIDEARKDPEQNRRLFFYFAGHGISLGVDTTNNALCLANWSERKRNDALSSKEYHDAFINFGLFRQVIILLDCCREIKVNVYPKRPDESPAAGSGTHQAEVFWGYATRQNNLSYEITTVDGERRGVFTYVLLNGLRGGAANEKGIVDSINLKRYLDRYVPQEANRKKYTQKPEINNGLAEPEAVFAKVEPAGLVPCAIRFNPQRTGPIELFDGLGQVIQEIVDAGGKEVTFHLEKGLYILKDKSNNDVYPIDIESFRFPLKNPEPFPINF